MTTFPAFTWLVHGALASTILLSLGALAVSMCRQPADRLRLVQWSLAATLGALVLLAIPQFSALSLGVLGSLDTAPPSASALSAADASDLGPAPALALPVTPHVLSDEIATAPRHAVSAPGSEAPHQSITSQQAPTRHVKLADLVVGGVCLAYALGLLVFLTRFVRARMGLVRLVRNACEVPPEVAAEFSRIAGAGAKRIRLLASAEIAGPVTFGTRQAVIVLPSGATGEPDRVRLRYYLAHEWAHVSRRDFATWQFAILAQTFLYYQPLFWWLRRRLAVCMDQLADADASEQGDSTVDYADFLVRLARQNLAANPQLSLGIGDRHSSLRERVVFLLNAARPRPICTPARSMLIGSAALLLAALVSVVRLDAQSAAAPQPPVEKTIKPAPGEPTERHASPFASEGADGSITYTGEAVDAVTHQPIPGVKVTVHHKESHGWTTLKVTDHETGADGRYSFVIPPEEAALDQLYIEVEAHHPNFASHSRSGYSHAMIRKNLRLGEDPFYSHISLWPGEAVTGTIVTPEGEPLADVEVSIYSSSSLSNKPFRGAWDKVKTDAQGHFRIVPATPGDGVLWVKPEHYAPQAHRLGDRRGDWGKLAVQKADDLTGRVLDVQGNPVANVKLEARRRGDGEKSDEFLNQNAVAGQIGRTTVTGSGGEFTLSALPAGDYVLEIKPNGEGYHPPPLEQVFLRTKVEIVAGSQPQPLEIRAVPHVVFHGSYLDGAGKPRRGHEVRMFGRVDGDFFYRESNVPGEDGKFMIRVPHGLAKAELDISTNEHSSIRWRMAHDQPLHRGRRPQFGTLEDDVHGFEIIRYRAPVVLVKPLDESGEPLKDCKPVLKYTRKAEGEELTVYTTGSHVSFEEQQDGRWRSEQLLPDEPATVTVEKAGYSTTAVELSLPEGEERSLTFVLKKDFDDKPEGTPPAEGKAEEP